MGRATEGSPYVGIRVKKALGRSKYTLTLLMSCLGISLCKGRPSAHGDLQGEPPFLRLPFCLSSCFVFFSRLVRTTDRNSRMNPCRVILEPASHFPRVCTNKMRLLHSLGCVFIRIYVFLHRARVDSNNSEPCNQCLGQMGMIEGYLFLRGDKSRY